MEINEKKGVILKSLGGFYYVDTDNGIIETRARGLFRKNNIKPLVGDRCVIRITKEDAGQGYIEEILKRQNSFVRPPVANIDQLILMFSAANPSPNYRLIDKFLIQSEYHDIHTVLCINKMELDSIESHKLKKIYEKAGYQVILLSVKQHQNLEAIKDVLKDKISVFSGPSGVGKSTLLNEIETGLNLKTGVVSTKTSRGKHTTRHVELFKLSSGGWVVDTAGFTSLDLKNINKENLKQYFKEFREIDQCRFLDCNHHKEPGCMVKAAVDSGDIVEERYKTYVEMLEILINGGSI